MTPEPPPLHRLLHLVDRAEDGVILPAEAAQLRTAIRALYGRAYQQERPAMTEPLRRYRAWLANEHAKAVAADQSTDCPPELRISPHNGIAAGLATALHGLDHHATRHDNGPTVREAADADRNWDVEKAGEQ